MKKFFISFAVLLTMVLAGNKSEAQMLSPFEVFIGDSLQGTNVIYGCSGTDSIFFYVYISGTACEQTDLISMGIDFGDGVDSLFSKVYGWGIGYSFYHQYAPGNYQLMFWGSEPGGEQDTAIMNIHISSGCISISGKLYEDQNSNCTFDAGEPFAGNPGQYFYITASDGINQVATTWADINGIYTFTDLPDDISYTIMPHNYYYQSNCYAGVCPIYATVPAGSSAVEDFGYYSDNTTFDLAAAIYGWGFRPGMNCTVSVYVFNQNCNYPMGGTLKVVLDPLLTYSSANYSLAGTSGDTLIFNVPSLSGSGNQYQLIIEAFTSVSAVYGDPISCMAKVEPLSGDSNPLNNITALRSEVRASWDPNDKQVAPQGQGPEGFVEPNTQFSYLIRFQNTGNAEAINIRVIDTLDSDLDVNTFHFVNSSHYCTYSILPGNIVEFRFDNIMLPDSTTSEALSHGFVFFTIGMKPNLAEGTQMLNTAHIYFDFNPAIVTNTTLNTFVTNLPVAVPVAEMLSAIVYPNPATDNVRFSLPENTFKLEVCNTVGTVLKQVIPQKQVTEINIRDISKGVYFVKIYSSKGVATIKFVKE